MPLPLVDRATLHYSPYPGITLPTFDPLIGLGLLGLLMPAAVCGGDQGLPGYPSEPEATSRVDQDSGQREDA